MKRMRVRFFEFIPICHVRVAIWVFTLLMNAGCSNGGPSPTELTVSLREQLGETKLPFTVESVAITKSEQSGDPPQFRLEFTMKQRVTEDLFLPVTLDEAYAEYQYDVAPFQAAVVRLGQLRVPERAHAAEKLPSNQQLKGIYRKIRADKDEFECTGSIIAVREGKTWKFDRRQLKLPDDLLNVSIVKRAQLRNDAIILDGANATNAVSNLIEQQKLFVNTVDAAAQQMEARLARERSQLMASSEVGRSWSVLIPIGKGPPTKVRATFIERTDDGKSVIVLFTNIDQSVERSVWSGSLELKPLPNENFTGRVPPGTRPDGWAIRLAPVSTGTVFPMADSRQEITLATAADDALFLANLAQPLSFAADEQAPKLPTYESLVATLKEGTAPGQTWEGTLRYPGQASTKVRMTFMEHRDDGQYVRTVVEPSEDPYASVVCVGTIGKTIANIYSQPIQLKFAAGQQFRGGVFNLGFSLDGTESLQGDGLTLTRVDPVKDFLSGRNRWTAALQPGAKWTGTIALGLFPGQTEKLTFTVTEVRDDLAYVRATAEGASDSSEFRVFEGAVSAKEAELDGFAFVVRGKTNTRNTPGGVDPYWSWAFFGITDEYPHSFRLLPDGKTIVGISKLSERIKLTREEENAPVPLGRVHFVQTWKEKCAVGSRWRGKLRKRSDGQQIDVNLEFVKHPSDPEQIAAVISIAKQSKFKVGYLGQLLPDNDINVNGYALTLKKQTSGIGDSVVLGKSTGSELHFRFSHDGQQLMGVAGGAGFGGGHLGHWPEIIELTRVEDAEPNAAADTSK